MANDEAVDEKMMLHVEGLTRSVTGAHLQDIFSTYGDVTRAMVEKDKRTGLSKGYGYVEFAKREFAEAAQLYLNGAQIDGQVIKASIILINRKRRSPSPRRDRSSDRRRRSPSPRGARVPDRDRPADRDRPRKRSPSPRRRERSPPRRDRSPPRRDRSPPRRDRSPPRRRYSRSRSRGRGGRRRSPSSSYSRSRSGSSSSSSRSSSSSGSSRSRSPDRQPRK